MIAWSYAAQILTVLGGVGGIGALLRIRSEMRKLRSEAKRLDADSEGQLTHAAVALLAPAQQQVDWLTTLLKSANQQIADLTKRVHDLEQQVDQVTTKWRHAESELNNYRGHSGPTGIVR